MTPDVDPVHDRDERVGTAPPSLHVRLDVDPERPLDVDDPSGVLNGPIYVALCPTPDPEVDDDSEHNDEQLTRHSSP